jgi:Domain of unknown function (DUF6378)
MRAADICDRAADLLGGDRWRQRGEVRTSHTRNASLRLAYRGHPITPHDVALMMLLLRVARAAEKTFNLENYVGVAGHAGIAAELASHA